MWDLLKIQTRAQWGQQALIGAGALSTRSTIFWELQTLPVRYFRDGKGRKTKKARLLSLTFSQWGE
ncbi:hypothetical protein THS27_23170 [Thalassospira sp. MCCC 1A01428]|nr:hypothetical protein THS27_26050 [Thalassospira sp. MCCC 1A01428]OSQ36931.1 hypothetical protein THS27_23170 [Thalassospira sp. MCCC 1A01428]